MTFWDSSAIFPLLVHEPTSLQMHRLIRRTAAPVVWWGTFVECFSALARHYRTGDLTPAQMQLGADRLHEYARAWLEIQPGESVRSCALRLLPAHQLRAADALQLAAALVWADLRPVKHPFVCLDHRLRLAAQKEGFRVLPEELPTLI